MYISLCPWLSRWFKTSVIVSLVLIVRVGVKASRNFLHMNQNLPLTFKVMLNSRCILPPEPLGSCPTWPATLGPFASLPQPPTGRTRHFAEDVPAKPPAWKFQPTRTSHLMQLPHLTSFCSQLSKTKCLYSVSCFCLHFNLPA